MESRNRNLKKIITVSLAALTVVNIIILALAFTTPRLIYSSDFVPYMLGGKMLKNDRGHSLYDVNEQEKYEELLFKDLGVKREAPVLFLPYKNLPVVAIPYSVISNLTLAASYRIVFVINLLLYTASTLLLIKLKVRPDGRKKRNKLNILAITACTPAAMAIAQGQLSILILLIFLLVIVAAKKGKYLAAGLSTGALTIKPQFLLALPFLMLIPKRGKARLNFFVGIAFALVVIATISIKIVGIEFPTAYTRFLIITGAKQYGTSSDYMATLHSTLKNFGVAGLNGPILIYLNALVYLLITGLVYIKNHKKHVSKDILYSLAILNTLVFSIHSHTHDLVLLLIPTFLLVSKRLTTVRVAIAFTMYTSNYIVHLELAWVVALSLFAITLYLALNCTKLSNRKHVKLN